MSYCVLHGNVGEMYVKAKLYLLMLSVMFRRTKNVASNFSIGFKSIFLDENSHFLLNTQISHLSAAVKDNTRLLLISSAQNISDSHMAAV